MTFAKRKWDFTEPKASVGILRLPMEVHTKNTNGRNVTVPTSLSDAERLSGVRALPFKHN